MPAKEIIETLLQKATKAGGVHEVFLIACGGSLVDMYPAKYFLESEARVLRVVMMTANEFVHATPRSLGATSLAIVCSHGGNTQESVEAARIARSAGASVVTLTHNASADLLKWTDHNILYAWGSDSRVADNPMAIILNIALEILHQVEGYAAYDDFCTGLNQIDGVVASARGLVAERTRRFATNYAKEDLFYILSSGASFGHAYGFAICSLMEMQWLDAAAVHSGEFFHGPFEVTDKETPFILMMNEGRTRPLDERVRDFLQLYAAKIEIIDAKELGLGIIPAPIVDYFNPILFYSIICEYRSELSISRNHPLETRRYMGKTTY